LRFYLELNSEYILTKERDHVQNGIEVRSRGMNRKMTNAAMPMQCQQRMEQAHKASDIIVLLKRIGWQRQIDSCED